MIGSPPVATVVMYHFVRPLPGARFPRLAALDLAAFRGQIAYIGRYYTPVTLGDLIAAAGGAPLPARPIVLTFDDGYSDHYRHAFPILREAGITGAFFPTARALVDRRTIDVNRIQFILAASVSAEPLVAAIEAAVREREHADGSRTVEAYRRDGWAPTRYDTADVAYVKAMLQRLLPEDMRADLIDAFFADLVTRDEQDFAAGLYFTIDEAREMMAAGMEIGCHGDRHLTLTSLTRDGQTREIDGALRVLDAVGLPRTRFFFCYAKGQHNADSLELLRARGCAIGLTTRVGLAALTPESMLTLPRIDTNDLPVDGAAGPNEWTRRATLTA